MPEIWQVASAYWSEPGTETLSGWTCDHGESSSRDIRHAPRTPKLYAWDVWARDGGRGGVTDDREAAIRNVHEAARPEDRRVRKGAVRRPSPGRHRRLRRPPHGRRSSARRGYRCRHLACGMNATDHLDRLGEALEGAGWRTARRYWESPALLRVFSSDLPEVGKSIWVKPGVNGVPWFIASTGDPLAPCHAPDRACAEIAARLSAFGCVPSSTVDRPRWRERVRAALTWRRVGQCHGGVGDLQRVLGEARPAV